MFVSAVGVGTFTNSFMKTSYADSGSTNGKNGKSTGFSNLEQDTDKDNNYNTGYGLHTNKTAKAADDTTDGRTFDVDLESWYVGENPVDVATVLDASGSMAWTVDTLDPLAIDPSSKEFQSKFESIKEKYDSIDSIDDLIELQNDNGGYLPQDVVDCILDTNNTDNSRLSYANYKYYIYESRSTVSEFVPLGYWDGGEPTDKLEPIGYYKFDGSLKNEVGGGTAKYIAQDRDGFYTNKAVTSIPVEFSDDGLDLYKTDKNGNVVIDLSSLEGENFTISFKIYAFDKHATCYNTPLVYVGDSAKNDYYALYRGDSESASSTRNANKFRIVNENKQGGASAAFSYKSWITCTMTFTYDIVSSQYKIVCKAGSTTMLANDNDELKFTDKDFYLILGGNELLQYSKDGTDISKNKIKDLKITSGSATVANFPLTSSMKNEVSSSSIGDAALMKESTGDTFNVTKAVEATTMDAKYKNGGLDLNETAKNGAIMLDVTPKIADDKDGFTISMRILKEGGPLTKAERNIFYLGDKNIDKKDYYQFFRSAKAGGYLALTKGNQNDLSSGTPTADENKKYMYYKGGVATTDTWYTSTLVFTPVGEGKFTVTPYVDGKKATEAVNIPELESLSSADLVFLLGALQNDAGDEGTHYIDDLYIFDEALEDDEVALIAANKLAPVPETEDGCGFYHAKTIGGTQDIAQISESLGANPNDDERKGWYYVNSHSKWEDVSGCLAGGKQYLGVLNDEYLGKQPGSVEDLGGDEGQFIDTPAAGFEKDNKSIATIPSVYEAANDETLDSEEETNKFKDYYDKLIAGNDETKEFTHAENERSLQFYVDQSGFLRCFYSTGDLSWKKASVKNSAGKSETHWQYSPRTFCSVVYVKEKYDVEKRIKGDKDYGDPTKYEELNYALNQFYKNLATYSDLSNTAIVRFSTNNLVQGDTETDVKKSLENNLKMLIMKDWMNYSDVYIRKKEDSDRDKYLQDLLISDEAKKSTDTVVSAHGTNEYPYVMTGGTYTWMGLKAFYDNMVDKDATGATQITKDIANDARDKYLILFTDGRDNLYGNTSNKKFVSDYSTKKSDDKTVPDNYGKFYPDPSTNKYKASLDSELAKVWAKKLKDEGYTIFCVMLATGSISEDTNKEEFEKAYDFLKTLAGDNTGKYAVDDCLSIVGGKGENTLEKAFADILTKIQQPRNDYTVQDYIDPRFDLVDVDGNLYKLGAGGKITVTNEDGNPVASLTLSDKTLTSGNEYTVGTVIDPKEGQSTIGLAYTPRKSEMVNRKDSTDMKGDIGTGYIYYDYLKDMYYLRWTDQIIPMENEAFNTAPENNHYLDVWSATIRLKAKDDFIGGNDILTNGNEAGENLVYSDATIENMDKNADLYFTTDELNEFKDSEGKYNVPYRKKLEALSGTNRKINAVDAGGVSQAVYGNGIDIPSSGFPRVVVDVRLKPLDAKDLNDVIYMGEVISPTMMLADLENGYMTGSYYLEYLARYAYRLYGYEAAKTPLLDLLNQWLKINEEEVAEKTFTIPYMYLPEPIYNDDGTLELIGGNVVAVKNSTGMSTIPSGDYIIANFEDLNLCDVTGFITYTWKREDPQEEQQDMGKVDSEGKKQYDITREYVVKNTDQIKYNLQLKFTPLKDKELTGFTLDKHFIKADSVGKGGEKFFNIDSATNEFTFTGVTEWSINYDRTAYLKAMVSETKTYEPHVMYNKDGGKWVLVDNSKTGFSSEDAVKTYTEADKTEQTTANFDEKTVTDKGVYDWDSDYKEVAGTEQIEKVNINDYYTGTPKNVQLVDAAGNAITDETGKITEGSAPCSIVANTTYVKDVVNGALALELVVDGKYLGTDSQIKANKEYTFDAIRYYDDPLDPLPYGDKETKNADTGEADTVTGVKGKNYQLTFKVKSIPDSPKAGEIYTVWAELSNVAVEDDSGTPGKYININNSTIADNPYLGYTDADSLPIGTYVISVNDSDMGGTGGTSSQYYIGNDGSGPAYFKYLKLDNASSSYTYNRFPENVYTVSSDAAADTGDNEYLINNSGVDNAPKNIAGCNRIKASDKQELTFYFGTVAKKTISGTDELNTKGYDRNDAINHGQDYAKDRLGIILLSSDNNALTISKEVTNTNSATDHCKYDTFWKFNIDFKLNDNEEEFERNNETGFKLTWYQGDDIRDASVMGSDYPNPGGGTSNYPEKIKFEDPDGDGTYTATIYLKHNEKVRINGLPEGTWQVKEAKNDDLFYSPHNNAHGLGDGEWEYERADATSPNIQLNPASHVDFVNEFPYELPSAGGIGVDRFIFFGTVATVTVALTVIASYYKRRKRRRIN